MSPLRHEAVIPRSGGAAGGLGLNPEELVEGGEELGAAEPTLLDVDDGAVCIVEGGHG